MYYNINNRKITLLQKYQWKLLKGLVSGEWNFKGPWAEVQKSVLDLGPILIGTAAGGLYIKPLMNSSWLAVLSLYTPSTNFFFSWTSVQFRSMSVKWWFSLILAKQCICQTSIHVDEDIKKNNLFGSHTWNIQPLKKGLQT